MELSNLPVIPTSAGAFVGLIVVMILMGWLQPKRNVEKIEAAADRRVKQVESDRDMWKEAYRTEAAVSRELTSQVGSLLEVGRTADHVIRSLPAAAAAVEGSRDDAVSP